MLFRLFNRITRLVSSPQTPTMPTPAPPRKIKPVDATVTVIQPTPPSTRSVLIDTNLLMDPLQSGMFNCLPRRLADEKLLWLFPQDQGREIRQLQSKVPSDTARGRAVRVAVTRLDEISRQSIFKPIPRRPEHLPCHVDRVFLKMMIVRVRRGEHITLVTYDRDLRNKADQLCDQDDRFGKLLSVMSPLTFCRALGLPYRYRTPETEA